MSRDSHHVLRDLGNDMLRGMPRLWLGQPLCRFRRMRLSLAAGKRVGHDPAARSICDALLAPIPGELTFALARRLLAGGLAVSDDEVRHAMAVAFEEYKLVLEPGGAAALAAALSGKLDLKGKVVAVIASGGNVDRATFATALKN